MSYLTYALLTEDIDFGRRSRSCIIEQSNGFLNDSAVDVAALARALLRNEGAQTVAMLQGIAAGPQFDSEVDMDDGTIDSSKIGDLQILAQCQNVFPVVASLYYDSTGAPIS
jgi:acyl CoA:acetate/3-ketoacid CoA transferase beta subunit